MSGSEYEDIFNDGINNVPWTDPQTFLAGEPGCLTVIDLIGCGDAETAYLLFDVSLSVFLEKTNVGKVVALDKAHNYLREGAAASNFIKGLENLFENSVTKVQGSWSPLNSLQSAQNFSTYAI